MKKLQNLFFFLFFSVLSVGTYAQTTKIAKPWEPIKETDILLHKRIWRELNGNDKQNLALTHTDIKSSFIDVLNRGIKTGKIEVYEDDRFTKKMTTQQAQIILDDKNINRLDIKEDLIMYGEDGKLVVRILGMAPMKAVTIADSTVYQPVCWIYYPATRDYLTQYLVDNKNTDTRITWDDFFEDRLFNGKVIKLSGWKN